jgi:hypothetical protein
LMRLLNCSSTANQPNMVGDLNRYDYIWSLGSILVLRGCCLAKLREYV